MQVEAVSSYDRKQVGSTSTIRVKSQVQLPESDESVGILFFLGLKPGSDPKIAELDITVQIPRVLKLSEEQIGDSTPQQDSASTEIERSCLGLKAVEMIAPSITEDVARLETTLLAISIRAKDPDPLHVSSGKGEGVQPIDLSEPEALVNFLQRVSREIREEQQQQQEGPVPALRALLENPEDAIRNALEIAGSRASNKSKYEIARNLRALKLPGVEPKASEEITANPAAEAVIISLNDIDSVTKPVRNADGTLVFDGVTYPLRESDGAKPLLFWNDTNFELRYPLDDAEYRRQEQPASHSFGRFEKQRGKLVKAAEASSLAAQEIADKQFCTVQLEAKVDYIKIADFNALKTPELVRNNRLQVADTVMDPVDISSQDEARVIGKGYPYISGFTFREDQASWCAVVRYGATPGEQKEKQISNKQFNIRRQEIVGVISRSSGFTAEEIKGMDCSLIPQLVVDNAYPTQSETGSLTIGERIFNPLCTLDGKKFVPTLIEHQNTDDGSLMAGQSVVMIVYREPGVDALSETRWMEIQTAYAPICEELNYPKFLVRKHYAADESTERQTRAFADLSTALSNRGADRLAPPRDFAPENGIQWATGIAYIQELFAAIKSVNTMQEYARRSKRAVEDIFTEKHLDEFEDSDWMVIYGSLVGAKTLHSICDDSETKAALKRTFDFIDKKRSNSIGQKSEWYKDDDQNALAAFRAISRFAFPSYELNL